jgi:L,D-transpeptidase YnhG
MSSLNMRTMVNGRLRWLALFLMVALLSFAGFVYLAAKEPVKRVASLPQTPAPFKIPDGVAKAHLIEILFENTPTGLNLVSDCCISVGKVGTSKSVESDQRAPLGTYHIANSLDRKSLEDFYGPDALPINYPNMLDAKYGKTGSEIGLQGTPANQFSRALMATDGCVVLANLDLNYLIRTVEVHSTPVMVANQLCWVAPHSIQTEDIPFKDTLAAWHKAKTSGAINPILNFYTPDFSANGKTLARWMPALKTEINRVQGRSIQPKDVSYLRWIDIADTMIVTFGEVVDGARTSWTKQQYWARKGRWKIFF